MQNKMKTEQNIYRQGHIINGYIFLKTPVLSMSPISNNINGSWFVSDINFVINKLISIYLLLKNNS